MTDESFNRVQSIASTPHFRKHVRGLKIFWNLLDKKSLADKKAYCSLLETTPHHSVSEEQLNSGYGAVQSLLEQHERLSPQISQLLFQTLPLFPNLIEFEPGIAWEVLHHEEAMDIESGTVQKLARETLLTGAVDGWQQGPYPGAGIQSLFSALSQTLYRGQKLILFNCGGNISSDFLEFPPHMLKDAETVSRGLKEVRLRLEMQNDEALNRILGNRAAARFLGWLVSTERLCLQTSYQNCLVDLSCLLSTVTLPRLNHLALYRLSTSAECLISALDRHKATLAHISIVEVTLTHGSWKEVFEGLRGERALLCFSFEDNYVWQGRRYPAGSFDVCGAKMNTGLGRFVFEGGEWPEECESLELEAFAA